MADANWGNQINEIQDWLTEATETHDRLSKLTVGLDELKKQIQWYKEKLAQAEMLVKGNDDRHATLQRVKDMAQQLGDVRPSSSVISEPGPQPAEPPKGGRR